MVIIIIVIGILTALGQIISSFYDLKNPNPQVSGIKKITPYGWFFYACTIILALLPALQKEIQDNIDDKKDQASLIMQEQRDELLRKRYDSSLIAMKQKYDTTGLVISEVLGKYGFKLDSANKVLVNIKDSSKTRVIETSTPVLQLTSGPEVPGIQFMGNGPNGTSKFGVYIQSNAAGSSGFKVKHRFMSSDTITDKYLPCLDADILDADLKIAKEEVNRSYHYIALRPADLLLMLWVRGTYKRDDMTGSFNLNMVYCYNAQTKTVTIIKGETKKNVMRFIDAHE